MKRDSASRGFTLIEVVVSLAILSLVLLGTVTGLRTLGNTQVSLERVTQRADEVRTVSAFLRDLMESAVVGSGSGGLTLAEAVVQPRIFAPAMGSLNGKLTSCSESPMEELMSCELVQRAINLY